MKKLFLLLTASSIGLSLTAQESKKSVVFSAGEQVEAKNIVALPERYKQGYTPKAKQHSNLGHKTTVGGSRWYNYGQYLDTTQVLLSGSTGLSATIIWNDTSGMVNYTSGLAHNTMVSNGAIFHPQIDGFNDSTLYPGEIAVRAGDAYIVDSITLVGLYLVNPAKTTVHDTLTISFSYGVPNPTTGDIISSYFTNPTVLANYGLTTTDSLHFAVARYDSVLNTIGGTTKYTMKFVLDQTMWDDTTAGGLWFKTLPINGLTGFAVPAGNVLGYSVSFKSGDATYVPNSTIEDFTGVHTYNLFRPVYAFNGTSTVPVFPPYVHPALDYNGGGFKKLPNYANGWGNVYVPMYAWTSGGAASTLQHSFYDLHVKCATCGLTGATPTVNGIENTGRNITSAHAFPNPATAELNVSFTTTAAVDVTVTLSNVVGKVVATQTIANTANGTATFNTAKLASGVYFYTVTANNERSTGRVVVAH